MKKHRNSEENTKKQLGNIWENTKNKTWERKTLEKIAKKTTKALQKMGTTLDNAPRNEDLHGQAVGCMVDLASGNLLRSCGPVNI